VNSAIIDLSATAIALIFAGLAAYAIARLPLPGKGIVMALVLAVSMFPQISIVTPIYQVLNQPHLLDTYRGLSGVYIGLALPLMVHILWGYFRTIPTEIDDAAKIDGAGPVRMPWSVIIPRYPASYRPRCSASSRPGTSCCSRYRSRPRRRTRRFPSGSPTSPPCTRSRGATWLRRPSW